MGGMCCGVSAGREELRWVVVVSEWVRSALGGGAVLCFGRCRDCPQSSAKSGELRVAARPGCRLSRLHPD